jgi:hypothetical protein
MSKIHTQQVVLKTIEQLSGQIEKDREGVFQQFQNIQQLMDTEHISLSELCRTGGSKKYRYHRYLMDVFYLTLGECYDFAKKFPLAKQCYELSGQPAAQWRLAKLYMTRDSDGKSSLITKLLIQSLNTLLGDSCDETYFTKKLGYLECIYSDLNTFRPEEYGDLYFDLLKWVIDHKSFLKPSHHTVIRHLLSLRIPCQTHRHQVIINVINELISRGDMDDSHIPSKMTVSHSPSSTLCTSSSSCTSCPSFSQGPTGL